MLIVLSLGLLIYKPLFFIGFEISKASLDKIVKTNRNSAGDQDGWAGIYSIVEVRELEDVAIWVITHRVEDYEGWGEAGFVYWIQGSSDQRVYQPLGGGWYYFSD